MLCWTIQGWPHVYLSGYKMCIPQSAADPFPMCMHAQDLKEAVAKLKADPKLAKRGNAPLYGMAAVVPDRSIVGEFLVAFQDIQFEL